ncbi:MULTISPECIES: META domain-containing protein [Anaerolinea]|uniref:META domain-containing protein n=1 Tax=Anaerolinea TaxID=233189 RepID=UPI00263896EA|nr:META domain-containing protein [Anaerolinea thermophila]
MKKLFVLCLICLILLSVVLSACSGNSGEQNPLKGTVWALETLGESAAYPGVDVIIDFGDGEVQGNTGCNNFSGKYSIKKETIEFKDISMTMMACQEPAINAQENAFLNALQLARSYRTDGNMLELLDEYGETLMILRRY